MRWLLDFLNSNLGVAVSAMASEYGVLPSVAVWGSPALEERTEFHLAFDFAAFRALERARKDARDKANPHMAFQEKRDAIRSGKLGAVGSGLNMPRPTPYEG